MLMIIQMLLIGGGHKLKKKKKRLVAEANEGKGLKYKREREIKRLSMVSG